MERENREKQTPIEFRCRKIIPGVEKNINVSSAEIKVVDADANEGSGNFIASPTPEKSDRKLSSKEKKLYDNSPSQDIQSETPVFDITLKFTELPEKLKILANLFTRMCTSIRLLGLRKRLSTFKNISTQVEILAKRKFSYVHLAQMKYVYPDVIQIEKVFVHDERTLCMKPDLKVSFLFDLVGCSSYSGQSIYMVLCHTFRVRLLEQFNTSQDVDIPVAVLPEPFNLQNDMEYPDPLPFSELSQPALIEVDSYSSASHFSSLQRRFCQKVVVPEYERTKLLSSASLHAIFDEDVDKNYKNVETVIRKDSAIYPSAIQTLSDSTCIPSPDKLFERTPEKGASTSYDMGAKLVEPSNTCITPQSYRSKHKNVDQIQNDVLAETPSMQTPKRPIPTPTGNLISTDKKSVNEPTSILSVRRTLVYSPQRMNLSKSKLDFDSAELTQVHEHYSDEIISSKIDNYLQEKNLTCDAINSEKRRTAVNCLLDMFDTILLICRSFDCSLITKKDLVHKIISNNLDIEETSEVEEQLCLLEELVPNWLCKKGACNGDFLYCIKRLPDPNAVRSRLSEAV